LLIRRKHRRPSYAQLVRPLQNALPSGSCFRTNELEMVKDVNPKRSFPVHTENQQLFKTFYSSMQEIEKGKEYFIKQMSMLDIQKVILTININKIW
jgi:mRNA degradation ribonuclease J1/J2